MVTVSRQVLLPFLALVLVPLVFSVLAPNPLQAGETPTFLLASAAPTERLAPPVTWLTSQAAACHTTRTVNGRSSQLRGRGRPPGR